MQAKMKNFLSVLVTLHKDDIRALARPASKKGQGAQQIPTVSQISEDISAAIFNAEKKALPQPDLKSA